MLTETAMSNANRIRREYYIKLNRSCAFEVGQVSQIWLANNGTIWAVSNDYKKVFVLGLDGTLIRSIRGGAIPHDDDFVKINCIKSDMQGRVWCVDGTRKKAYLFSEDGELVDTYELGLEVTNICFTNNEVLMFVFGDPNLYKCSVDEDGSITKSSKISVHKDCREEYFSMADSLSECPRMLTWSQGRIYYVYREKNHFKKLYCCSYDREELSNVHKYVCHHSMVYFGIDQNERIYLLDRRNRALKKTDISGNVIFEYFLPQGLVASWDCLYAFNGDCKQSVLLCRENNEVLVFDYGC